MVGVNQINLVSECWGNVIIKINLVNSGINSWKSRYELRVYTITISILMFIGRIYVSVIENRIKKEIENRHEVLQNDIPRKLHSKVFFNITLFFVKNIKISWFKLNKKRIKILRI